MPLHIGIMTTFMEHCLRVCVVKWLRLRRLRKLKLNCWICTLLAACLLLISACGNKEETSGAPTVASPFTPGKEFNLPGTTPDGRLPDLSRATDVFLTDTVNYSALYDITYGTFFPIGGTGSQIVGNVKAQGTIKDDRTNFDASIPGTLLEGKILIAFEDKAGFWGAELPIFPKAATRVGSSHDMIFADDEFVVRVIGSTGSGDAFSGTIYYRLRTNSDVVQYQYPNGAYFTARPCTQVTVTCGGGNCPGYTQPDTRTKCVNYMSTSNSSVKKLGTFGGKYSSWVTQ